MHCENVKHVGCRCRCGPKAGTPECRTPEPVLNSSLLCRGVGSQSHGVNGRPASLWVAARFPSRTMWDSSPSREGELRSQEVQSVQLPIQVTIKSARDLRGASTDARCFCSCVGEEEAFFETQPVRLTSGGGGEAFVWDHRAEMPVCQAGRALDFMVFELGELADEPDRPPRLLGRAVLERREFFLAVRERELPLFPCGTLAVRVSAISDERGAAAGPPSAVLEEPGPAKSEGGYALLAQSSAGPAKGQAAEGVDAGRQGGASAADRFVPPSAAGLEPSGSSAPETEPQAAPRPGDLPAVAAGLPAAWNLPYRLLPVAWAAPESGLASPAISQGGASSVAVPVRRGVTDSRSLLAAGVVVSTRRITAEEATTSGNLVEEPLSPTRAKPAEGEVSRSAGESDGPGAQRVLARIASLSSSLRDLHDLHGYLGRVAVPGSSDVRVRRRSCSPERLGLMPRTGGAAYPLPPGVPLRVSAAAPLTPVAPPAKQALLLQGSITDGPFGEAGPPPWPATPDWVGPPLSGPVAAAAMPHGGAGGRAGSAPGGAPRPHWPLPRPGACNVAVLPPACAPAGPLRYAQSPY